MGCNLPLKQQLERKKKLENKSSHSDTVLNRLPKNHDSVDVSQIHSFIFLSVGCGVLGTSEFQIAT